MKQIQDSLQTNHSATNLPPGTSLSATVSRIVGSSWAEEMNANDPLGKAAGSVTKYFCAPQRVMEISKRTERDLLHSFTCMEDDEQRELANSFVLPKTEGGSDKDSGTGQDNGSTVLGALRTITKPCPGLRH